MVHFYHGAESAPDLDALRNEQSDAWFALSRLITGEWRKAFSLDQWGDVSALSRQMIVSSTYYASAKYRSIKPELEQLQPDIHSCPVCLQMANLITRDDVIPAFTEHCRVCNQVEHYLSVPCPGCEQETRLDEGDEPFSCIHCGHTADRYDLVDEDDSLPED